MLNNLLFFLLFETVQPSYGLLIALAPEYAIVAAAPTLKMENAPMKTGDSIAPAIEAASVFAVDLESGMPLFTRDIFTRRPIASIAKLMTAITILDSHKLNEIVRVSRNAAGQEGSHIGLVGGEEITIGGLVTGMLVNSGNDAAVALAEYDSGSEKAFVQKMNAKAAGLGLINTHFSNAKGFDEPGNYSTAYETMIFAKAALDYPFIRSAAEMRKGSIASVNGLITHKLESTNELLGNSTYRVIGLKTGSTPAAGQSFVALMQTDGGREVLSVMLSSPNRFKETKILLDWILRNFTL